jgi:predicted esterase
MSELQAAGKPLDEAQAVMILIHGRGASAASILRLAEELYHPGFAYLAPQAPDRSWYPLPFLAPLEQNEPALSAALDTVGAVLDQVIDAGIPAENVILAGFSQGACLSAEFLARRAQRLGGLIVFSGGLIGPPGTPRDYTGSLAGTPVLIGCGDTDPHIPGERVDETAAVLTALGGVVDKHIYPGMGHMINADEIEQARSIVEAVSNS